MLGAAGAHSRRQCQHLSTPLGLHASCQNWLGPCVPLSACSHESSISCISHVRIQPGCTSNLDRLQGCVLLVKVDRTHVRHHLHAVMQSWVSHQASLVARGGSLLLGGAACCSSVRFTEGQGPECLLCGVKRPAFDGFAA